MSRNTFSVGVAVRQRGTIHLLAIFVDTGMSAGLPIEICNIWRNACVIPPHTNTKELRDSILSPEASCEMESSAAGPLSTHLRGKLNVVDVSDIFYDVTGRRTRKRPNAERCQRWEWAEVVVGGS